MINTLNRPPDCKANARDVNLFTPLENHLAVVLILLENGARINVEAVDGSTPLSLASGLGYADMVQVLLKNGARPKPKRPDSEVAVIV